ncbi:MAG: tripartite tricarboxylate transporter TctB family protein, partial [Deltaproteobacteria bacterium]|nr:tripartite tricarboxylate transporter TctB family protein [Deltaproteobacteria bacterium]
EHKCPVNWKDLGLYFNLLLIIWFILILAIGWNYPFRAKIFPMAIAALSIILTLGTFLSYFSENIKKILGSLAGSQLFDISAAKDIGHDIVKVEKRELTLLNLLSILLWFVGAGTLIYLLGYLIGIAIFLFAFLKFYVRHSLKMSLLMTGGTAFATWFIFSFFLEIPYLSVFFT